MRTEKRKASLEDISKEMGPASNMNDDHSAYVVHNSDNKKTTGPSPVLGVLTGSTGAIGGIAIWLLKIGLLPALIVSIIGCVSALICRGTREYDTLAAKACIIAGFISLLTATIILTVYLKSIDFWGLAK